MSVSNIKIPALNKIFHTVNETKPEMRENNESFKEIFYKTSLNTEDLSAIDKSFASKTQMIETLNNLQIQMNRHLINALSIDAKEDVETRYQFKLDRFTLSDIDLPNSQFTSKDPVMTEIVSSNNRHTNQNNDVFKVREDLDLIINQAAEAYGVDPALIKSVIKVESDFNSNSKSPKGAMGLMQLMPTTASDLGVLNAYNPAENIQAGTRYLKTLLKRYDGNIDMALTAYNWGMGNLEKKPGKIPAETKNYVENVIRYYDRAKA
jgi:hypothetical protein